MPSRSVLGGGGGRPRTDRNRTACCPFDGKGGLQGRLDGAADDPRNHALVNADLRRELTLADTFGGKIGGELCHVDENAPCASLRQPCLMPVAHLPEAAVSGTMEAMNNLQRLIKNSRFGSQRAIADFIGVDQATVQRACTEHKSAKLETYKLCATALGVTLADIFAQTDRLRAEEALIRAYRALTEDRQRGWDDLVATVLSQRPQSSQEAGQTLDPIETRQPPQSPTLQPPMFTESSR